jgi:hypothetical protein
LVAAGRLAVVGLGGWSLLDLSERRIRFVSAVTHELRRRDFGSISTLTGGLIETSEEGRILHTLHGESDRLHRLVSNVLDFASWNGNGQSRCAQLRQDWDRRGSWCDRCKAAGNSSSNVPRISRAEPIPIWWSRSWELDRQ